MGQWCSVELPEPNTSDSTVAISILITVILIQDHICRKPLLTFVLLPVSLTFPAAVCRQLFLYLKKKYIHLKVWGITVLDFSTFSLNLKFLQFSWFLSCILNTAASRRDIPHTDKAYFPFFAAEISLSATPPVLMYLAFFMVLNSLICCIRECELMSVSLTFRWIGDAAFVASFIHLTSIIPSASFVCDHDILGSASDSTDISCWPSK